MLNQKNVKLRLLLTTILLVLSFCKVNFQRNPNFLACNQFCNIEQLNHVYTTSSDYQTYNISVYNQFQNHQFAFTNFGMQTFTDKIYFYVYISTNSTIRYYFYYYYCKVIDLKISIIFWNNSLDYFMKVEKLYVTNSALTLYQDNNERIYKTNDKSYSSEWHENNPAKAIIFFYGVQFSNLSNIFKASPSIEFNHNQTDINSYVVNISTQPYTVLDWAYLTIIFYNPINIYQKYEDVFVSGDFGNILLYAKQSPYQIPEIRDKIGNSYNNHCIIALTMFQLSKPNNSIIANYIGQKFQFQIIGGQSVIYNFCYFCVFNWSCSDPLQLFDYRSLTCNCPINRTCSTCALSNVCFMCHYSCQQCLYSNFSYCLSCVNGTNRYSDNVGRCICMKGFYDNGTDTCANISEAIEGCLQGLNGSFCTQCDKKKSYLLRNNLCQIFPGCKSSLTIKKIERCMGCNEEEVFQFIPKDYSCQCEKGYYINKSNLDQCLSKCGDGLTVGIEQCDDGNIANGDGCSSECYIQNGFTCQGTLCVKIVDFTIYLLAVDRIIGENKAKISFGIDPCDSLLSEMNLSNYFKLEIQNISNQLQNPSIYITDCTVVVLIDYKENIQGKQCFFTLQFDPTIFQSVNRSLSFELNGMTSTLTYQQNAFMQQILQIMGYLLSGLVCAAFFLSLLWDKLIGIEIVMIVEIAYFSQMALNTPFAWQIFFRSLKFSDGFNQILPNDAVSYKIPNSFGRIGFQKEYLLNFNVMLGVLVLVVLVYIVLKLIEFYHFRKLTENESSELFQEKYKQACQRCNKTYSSIIMPLAVIFCFRTLVATICEFDRTKINRQYDILFSVIVIYLVMFFVFTVILVKIYEIFLTGRNSNSMQSYLSVYFSYLLTIILLVSLNIPYTLYITAGLTALYLLVLIIWRPYAKPVHNIGIIANHFILTLYLALMLLHGLVAKTEKIQLILEFGMVLLFAIAILFTFVRIYLEAKYREDTQYQLQRNQKQDKNIKKNYLENNRYLNALNQARKYNQNEIRHQNKKANYQQRKSEQPKEAQRKQKNQKKGKGEDREKEKKREIGKNKIKQKGKEKEKGQGKDRKKQNQQEKERMTFLKIQEDIDEDETLKRIKKRLVIDYKQKFQESCE